MHFGQLFNSPVRKLRDRANWVWTSAFPRKTGHLKNRCFNRSLASAFSWRLHVNKTTSWTRTVWPGSCRGVPQAVVLLWQVSPVKKNRSPVVLLHFCHPKMGCFVLWKRTCQFGGPKVNFSLFFLIEKNWILRKWWWRRSILVNNFRLAIKYIF